MRYWPQADRRLQRRGRKPAALRLVKTIREWTGAGCVVRKAKNWNWDGLVVEQFCHIITLRYYVTCPGVLQENDYCNYIWDFACLNGQLTRDSRESDACAIYTHVGNCSYLLEAQENSRENGCPCLHDHLSWRAVWQILCWRSPKKFPLVIFLFCLFYLFNIKNLGLLYNLSSS